MLYLLDTHILLWWLTDDPKLSENIKEIISDKKNTIFISSVSAWEISIKKALGRLTSPDNLEEMLKKIIF